jgi:DNA-binding CsgD family transcriptional regulator
MCVSDVLHLTCQQLGSCYGLTHAEANLATKLVEGMNVEESAQALDITYSTARTYLKQIFFKLGIKRQSELVLRISSGVWRIFHRIPR